MEKAGLFPNQRLAVLQIAAVALLQLGQELRCRRGGGAFSLRRAGGAAPVTLPSALSVVGARAVLAVVVLVLELLGGRAGPGD